MSQPADAPAVAEPIAAPAASEDVGLAVPDELVSDGGDGGGCNDSCGGCCNLGGLWYCSVDYLLVRTRMSQATAEVRETTSSDAANNTTVTDRAVQFPFKYQSSFRTTIGYRLLCCGGDIQFGYWRLNGTSGRVSDGPTSSGGQGGANPAISILSPMVPNLINLPNQGDNLFFSANSAVTANIFDVDFAKYLSLGGPQNPCDACACPRWDLRWSAGVRLADVSRFDNNAYSAANGTVVVSTNIGARFVGGGPRVGLQGRRYFGQSGKFAVFARASQGLLVGDYQQNGTNVVPGLPTTTITTNAHYNFARLVPVTDIEIGATWQIAPFTFISAGWFLQCWWDLGQGETASTGNSSALDTANILGFDGLFIRGEMLF
jgi:hypothetical protein